MANRDRNPLDLDDDDDDDEGIKIELLVASNYKPKSIKSIEAASAIAGVSLSISPSLTPGSLLTVNHPDERLQGEIEVLKYIGKVGKFPKIYDPKAIEEIDTWLDKFNKLSANFNEARLEAEKHLTQHTFFAGDTLTVADIAIWVYFHDHVERWKKPKFLQANRNLRLWYEKVVWNYGEKMGYHDEYEQVKKLLEPVITAKSKMNKREAVNQQTVDVDLPKAEVGKVHLRFAPEAGCYLHIGHTKAALLNQYFAERYNGTLIIHVDDTNPAKESEDFVDNLLKDIKTLGIKFQKFVYTSDYFPKLKEMAENLITKDKAYVDVLEPNEEEGRRDYRNMSTTENMKLWKEMINGSEMGSRCCLRGKLDIQSENHLIRDPIYYHCKPVPHHRIGPKYKIYPTYDFACPFVDYEEGITHALLSSENHDHKTMYREIRKSMEHEMVHIYEFSELNMPHTLLNKRVLSWLVDNDKVDGWSDARLPTVQGLVRRGLQIDALKLFVLEHEASKDHNLMEWDKLWTINKGIIDSICSKNVTILLEHRVLLTVKAENEASFPLEKQEEDGDSSKKERKKVKPLMHRIWTDYEIVKDISEYDVVFLKDHGRPARVEKIGKCDGIVKEMIGILLEEGSAETTKLEITGHKDIDSRFLLFLVEFNNLIMNEKLEDFHPSSKMVTPAVGDLDVRNLMRGMILHVEDRGYYTCDVPFQKFSEPIILFKIPNA